MDENNRTVPTVTRRPQCCACGQPLRTGEPHWAGDRQGRPWHYGCAEKAGLTYSWFNLRAARVIAAEATQPGAPDPSFSCVAPWDAAVDSA